MKFSKCWCSIRFVGYEIRELYISSIILKPINIKIGTTLQFLRLSFQAFVIGQSDSMAGFS